MTEHAPSLLELRQTDELLELIAERRTSVQLASHDAVAGLLVALAEAVDERPLPEISALRLDRAATPRRMRVRSRSRHFAAALAVGLTLASSGIAAAVTGDPLLPIKTVAKHLSHLGHAPDPQTNWILGGPARIVTGPPSQDRTGAGLEDPVRSSSRHAAARTSRAVDPAATTAERQPTVGTATTAGPIRVAAPVRVVVQPRQDPGPVRARPPDAARTVGTDDTGSDHTGSDQPGSQDTGPDGSARPAGHQPTHPAHPAFCGGESQKRPDDGVPPDPPGSDPDDLGSRTAPIEGASPATGSRRFASALVR